VEIDVQLLAFMDGDVRTVTIPDDEWRAACETDAANRSGLPDAALEKVFYYGQNDIQPIQGWVERHLPSVSVGDVAIVDGKCFRVDSFGFSAMTVQQLEAYVQTPQRDRYFWKESPIVRDTQDGKLIYRKEED
jgi:hypothetical protein